MTEYSGPRKKVVAGNWKMNIVPSRAGALAGEVLEAARAEDAQQVDIVLCPAAPALAAVHAAVRGRCAVGAQNMHWEAAGAYTGELSAPMLRDFCTHVILGHSERRQYFGETDQTVRLKVHAALQHGLVPILCVGETLAQREAGLTRDLIALQVRAALFDRQPHELAGLIVAYEPVWAIGTGVAASAQDAQEVAEHIRHVLADLGGVGAAARTRILYGGSVTSANAGETFAQADVDGALVGGASLKPQDFARIILAAADQH